MTHAAGSFAIVKRDISLPNEFVNSEVVITQRLIARPYFNPVVTQYYEAEVVSEYVIRGNAAILKCTIPSFVAEFVSVDSWVGSDGSTFKPTNDYGTTLESYPFLSFFLPIVRDRLPARFFLLSSSSAASFPDKLGKSSKWHVVTIRFRRGPVWRQLNGGGNATRVNEPSAAALTPGFYRSPKEINELDYQAPAARESRASIRC